MIVSIEQHVDWIATARHLRAQGLDAIEARATRRSWVPTSTSGPCHALHPATHGTGGEFPGKPRIFMPYVGGVGPTGSVR